jgi:nitroreductase/NAD-dependent dihydropyrimidine dehydrogenase PreA subunit
MISVDEALCSHCGACIRLMSGYCISESGGMPIFDLALCNLCQKCVAICPSRAIMVNRMRPEPISGELKLGPEELVSLFERRRSVKHFMDRPISRETLHRIVSVAKYAPNQNKNISILVVDDRLLLGEIDKGALAFVERYYRLLFSVGILAKCLSLFSKALPVIKRKMEHDLLLRKHVLKDNTQAILIAVGSRRVPVTEASAPYLLANMLYMAQALGVGGCLMDSLTLALRADRRLRRRLGIHEDVLGVLALGYSNENIVNIPRGYEVELRWNV